MHEGRAPESGLENARHDNGEVIEQRKPVPAHEGRVQESPREGRRLGVTVQSEKNVYISTAID